MKLWLIRHAQAADRETFSGSDMERPLTEKGIRRSRESFTYLAGRYKKPDIIYASEAVRAWQTAEIFSEAFGQTYEKTPLLNPGCSIDDMSDLIHSISDPMKHVVLIGHEPDFSEAVSYWTSDSTLNINLKKGALVELEFSDAEDAVLTMLVPPMMMIRT